MRIFHVDLPAPGKDGQWAAGWALLRIWAEKRAVKKGNFYCIPAKIPHGDTCLGDEPFVMLDIFHPVRKDFVEKLAWRAQ